MDGVENQDTIDTQTEGELLKFQKKITGLEHGKSEILSQIVRSLESPGKRPQIIFINGQAGAGKSYLSQEVKDSLTELGVNSIFLETDMYARKQGEAPYTFDDFQQQKQAWEHGQQFEYMNTKNWQREIVDASKLDVIVIGGIETRELGIEPLKEIFVTSPFLSRIASKGFRDHIVNAGGKIDIERFMDEIAYPPPGQDYLAHAFGQEKECQITSSESDLLIENTYAGDGPRAWLEGNILKFRAMHNGQLIETERTLSKERFDLLKKIIAINEPEAIRQLDTDEENAKRAIEGDEIREIKRRLAA